MMAGKYSKVIDALPRMLSTEAPYQERVEQVKASITNDSDFELHASTLAHEYAGLRAEKDKAESFVSEINLRLEAVSQLMADQFEIEGVSSLKTESGQSVAVQLEPYARVVDKEANRLWAIKNGLERMMSLPWQTINSQAKEMLLDGMPPPDGVEVFAKTKIVLRKA
jgi:hypothetical protein